MTYYINKSGDRYNSSYQGLYTVFAFAFLLLFLSPLMPGWNEVSAQNDDEMKTDFLFKKPNKYLGFRVGIFSPEADSDIFELITEELTLSKNDFRTMDFGIDLGFSLYERVDLVFSLDFSSLTEGSESRDYVENGLPITQSTKFSQTPFTAGIKYLLIPRGRQIGRYSWLPSTIVPYLTGGAGILPYEFKLHGDFVDDSTPDLEIFTASYKSSGTPLTYYLGGGTEFNISKSAFINLDFRYHWADDDLDSDFVGFDPIELGGYRLTAGIQWHF